jgi:hypothetical protein
MPKKKSTKKKPIASPRPKVAAPKAPPAEVLAAEPTAIHWKQAGLLAVALIVLVLIVLGSVLRTTSSKIDAPSDSSSSSPSTLQVTVDNSGGVSSNGSSDALQPQPGNLQQAPTTQSNNSVNLQAPSTPEITPGTMR